MRFLFVMSILSLMGCAHRVATNSDYMASQDYQNRDQLKKSLLNGANLPSETEVQKILNSRVVIPRKSKLAIIKLKSDQIMMDSFYYHRNSSEVSASAFILDEKIVQEFVGQLKKSNRIADIMLLPKFLIGDEVKFDLYRLAAIRAQADLFLILKPETFVDWRYNILEPNQAKAYATVEAVLVDTRTGVIPFSSVVTESDTQKKISDDYSMDETIKRTKQQAESKALVKIAESLTQFLASVP